MNEQEAIKQLSQMTKQPKDGERMCAICLQNVKRSEYYDHLETCHEIKTFVINEGVEDDT